MGEPGEKGGPSGDLYIIIYVGPHETFTREGIDISCSHPVSFVKAALGGEISVPTLEKNVTMKIPAGTQSNVVFRLKGKGIYKIGTQRRGNEYVKVIVQTPKNLSSDQKKLLFEFAKLSGENMDKIGEKGFFEKIKKTFS